MHLQTFSILTKFLNSKIEFLLANCFEKEKCNILEIETFVCKCNIQSKLVSISILFLQFEATSISHIIIAI